MGLRGGEFRGGGGSRVGQLVVGVHCASLISIVCVSSSVFPCTWGHVFVWPSKYVEMSAVILWITLPFPLVYVELMADTFPRYMSVCGYPLRVARVVLHFVIFVGRPVFCRPFINSAAPPRLMSGCGPSRAGVGQFFSILHVVVSC